MATVFNSLPKVNNSTTESTYHVISTNSLACILLPFCLSAHNENHFLKIVPIKEFIIFKKRINGSIIVTHYPFKELE